ncbi:MAG: orotate phosphoribosyltransferase [Lachnospiraceae bacterium]|nr:orotate phosphoribosyltransferase [Lachnospiraceae bacterium]
MSDRLIKFYARNDKSVTINAAQGHFATSHSHINYYIDVTRLKVRISEAKGAARFLKQKLDGQVETVDTIVCLDATQVIGALLGEEIEKGGFINNNNIHDTTYVIRPEVNSVNQFMFRENNKLAIEGKSVLVLVDTMTTGDTVKRAVECIQYYGGSVCGIAAIFSTIDNVDGTRVFTIFDEKDLPEYRAYEPHECPMCQKKIPLDAMVNGYGYAKL